MNKSIQKRLSYRLLPLLAAWLLSTMSMPNLYAQDVYKSCKSQFKKITNQLEPARHSSDFHRDLYQKILNNAHPLVSEAIDNASNRAAASEGFQKLGSGILSNTEALRNCESDDGYGPTSLPGSEEAMETAIQALSESLLASPSDAHDIRDRTDEFLALIDDNLAFLAAAGFTPKEEHVASTADSRLDAPVIMTSAKGVPETFMLDQNYPNPFNPTTMISYALPEGNHVLIQVFDLEGRAIATLQNSFQDAGSYAVSFDASSLSAGVYIYTIESGSFKVSKKMTLLK